MDWAASRWPGCSIPRSSRRRAGRPIRPSPRIAGEGFSTRHIVPIKARRVIHLCMAGGPSQFESFDYKPRLKELHGKPFPESFTKGQQLAQLQNMVLKARGPACGFHRHGQSGQEISDLFPHIAGIADRDLHRAVDDHGADQPRPCACLHEHRIDHQGAAEHGLLAAVRAGGRDRRPTRFHRFHLGRRQRAAAGVGPPVVGGNLAQQVSGHPVPVPGRRRSLHRQSARNRSRICSG